MIQLRLPRLLTASLLLAVASFGCDDSGDDDGDDSPPTTLPSGSEDAGSATGPGLCKGSATPCELLSRDFCDQTPGCHQGAFCSGGVLSSCDSFTTAAACGAAAGCSWSLNRCRGSVSPCTSWATKTDCSTHSGCSWKEGCTGTPPTCSDETTSFRCSITSGCKWTSL